MRRPSRKRVIGILTIIGTIALSLTLVSIPTETLLDTIGSQNAYLFVYLIALLGSITTFASIPYPLILISLVAGGLNPLLAGALSALGVITSDMITFYAARRGSALLPKRVSGSLGKASEWLQKYPKMFFPCLALYGTVSPLSNDLAVISLSLMGYSFWRVIPTLAIGNMIYNIGVAFLGVYAYDWIMNLL
jgi:uncharacterized membrane protein YdjX (TVP38/TMEM64 family)